MLEASLARAPDERGALIARVKLISWLSLVWMTAEGVIGTTAGIMANSIALIGYGVDSTITGIASAIIIWRFSGERVDSDQAEARAQKIVAITFFLLAPYIGVAAIHHLVTGSEAQASWVGIGLAVVSVTLMPLFGHAKKRIGNSLHSQATTGEGTQNILCAYLSLAILVGLAANAFLGLWWADPLVALIVATVALQTGARTWRGQGCAEVCERPVREQRTTGNRWADLIRAGYEALGRGDPETLASLLHDAAEWRGLPSGWRRRSGTGHLVRRRRCAVGESRRRHFLVADAR